MTLGYVLSRMDEKAPLEEARQRIQYHK